MCSIDGKVHNSVPISRYTGISATINQISLLPTVADTYASDVATSIKIFILYVLHSCDLSKEKEDGKERGRTNVWRGMGGESTVRGRISYKTLCKGEMYYYRPVSIQKEKGRGRRERVQSAIIQSTQHPTQPQSLHMQSRVRTYGR